MRWRRGSVRLHIVAMTWLALRAHLRLRWRAMAGLALLLGLAGGVVLTAAAGAWRTGTAYPRLLAWANAAQVQAVPGVPNPGYLAALTRLPQVAAVAPETQYTLVLPVAHGVPDFQLQAWASPGGSYGQSVDRVKITAGAMFSGDAADEAVIDPHLAAMEHLRPGDTLRLLGVPDYPPTKQNEQKGLNGPDLALAFPIDVQVTGIGVFDDQVVPVTVSDGEPMMLLGPGFTRTKAAASLFYLSQAGVVLRPGASPAAFIAAAKALERHYPRVDNQYSAFVNLTDQVAATERAMRPEAVALAIFAALAGLITLAVTGQLFARQLALDSAELPVLRALGATKGSLLAIAASLLSEGGQSQTCPARITCYDAFLLRYRPGTDAAAAASTLLAAAAKAGCPPGACTVTGAQQPGDIQDYAAVRATPLLLGVALAVLAVGTLAHVLATGVRRRRRDLAVLKALGLTGAQLRGAVAWEATALAVTALLIGVPAGIVAGRVAWAAFATEAGVATGATFDLALVLLTIPVTLLAANVIAAWPGRAAARLRPAIVLRTE